MEVVIVLRTFFLLSIAATASKCQTDEPKQNQRQNALKVIVILKSF